MKIQRTTFNPDAVKEMGFDSFKKTYSKFLRGDIKAHFESITGQKVPAKVNNKPKKDSE